MRVAYGAFFMLFAVQFPTLFLRSSVQ